MIRTDPVLRRYRLIRSGVALALGLFGLVMLSTTMIHQADSHRFEQRASRVEGLVVALGSSDNPYDWERVVVEYKTGGGTVRADAPVFDNANYEVGEAVEVLFETHAPQRVRLVGDPYYADGPALFAIVSMLMGAAVLVRSWLWIRRVTALAASDAPAFAMTGRLWRSSGSGFVGGTLALYPLDATPEQLPVATVKLMGDASEGLPASLPVLVRGVIADSSVVVIKAEDRIVWPRARLRAVSRMHRSRRGIGKEVTKPQRWIKPALPLVLGEREPRWWLVAMLAAVMCSLAILIGVIPLIAIQGSSAWTLLGPPAAAVGAFAVVLRSVRRLSVRVDASGLVIQNLSSMETVTWDRVAEIGEGEAPVVGMTRAGSLAMGLWISIHGRQRPLFCWGTASPKAWVVRAYAEAVRPWAESHDVPIELVDSWGLWLDRRKRKRRWLFRRGRKRA